MYRANDVRVPFDPSAAVIPTCLAAALMIVVAMVLLVAAGNIAGILLARGVGRSGEIAVRRVLGAPPSRIVRQLLAEAMMLSAAGGVLGIVLAHWLLSVFRTLTPIQVALDVAFEGRVFVFTAVICLAAGVVVAMAPAKQATSLDVLPWLSGSGAMQTKPVGRRLRHAVTLPQVVFSLVLLLVAVVYVRELLRVELRDVGYEPRNLLVASPVLQLLAGERPSRGTRDPRREERYAERTRRFYQQLLVRLRNIPGAPDVALTDGLPLREPPERPNWSVVTQEDGPARDGRVGAERASVSPGYFRTMGMALLAGRDFDERDTREAPKVAVISAAGAQRLWPGRDALDRTVGVLNPWAPNEGVEWYDVVGVVSDVSPVLHDRAPSPYVYLPLSQQWRPWISYVLVRGSSDSRTLIPALRDAVEGADARADVYRVQTMGQMIGEILYLRRIAAAVLGVSAMVAILLATLGVYGVVSYSVAQRIGEIGVRIALGAERGRIVRLLLREGATVAAVGSTAGLLLGYTAIKITSSRYLALPVVDITALIVTPLLLSA
ncbi:MAG TPA: FtsX-like permease family protein, partial [Vicinamibacterales bacterium]|nr:FtsX-like permease family protein [Vicinamibacterales bacterium]